MRGWRLAGYRGIHAGSWGHTPALPYPASTQSQNISCQLSNSFVCIGLCKLCYRWIIGIIGYLVYIIGIMRNTELDYKGLWQVLHKAIASA